MSKVNLLQKVLLDAVEAHINADRAVDALTVRLSAYTNPDESDRVRSRERWNHELGIRLQAGCTLEAVFDVDTVSKLLIKVQNGGKPTKLLNKYLKKLES